MESLSNISELMVIYLQLGNKLGKFNFDCSAKKLTATLLFFG